MRFLRYLNKPTIVLLVLGLVVIANGFLFYRQQATSPSSDKTSSGDRETPSAAGSATDEIDAASYAQNVGDIQNAAVQTFTRIHDRLRRYDTISAADIEAIEADYLALENYSVQAEDLAVPEEYKGQHEMFSGAIRNLYAAAEIARRVTAASASATASDFKEYDERVAEATSGLVQSNEILGQDYSTTEGLPKVGPSAL
jgi:hypothetical protein